MHYPVQFEYIVIICIRNTNAISRLQNSYVTSSHDPLIPLINPTTGVVIPHLPANSDAISGLPGKQSRLSLLMFTLLTIFQAPEIRGILRELGLDIPAQPVAILRRTLRMQMGLRAEQLHRP